LLRTGNHGLAFVGFRLAGGVVGRFGALRTLRWGSACSHTANLAGLLKPTVFSPAMLATESLTFGTNTVAASALLQREFTDRERATLSSLGSLLGSLLYGVLAVGAGRLADARGVVVALLACQAVGLVGLVLWWSVQRKASSLTEDDGQLSRSRVRRAGK
jgi:hypothetical protein